MSYTYCTKRERQVEVDCLTAAIFAETWMLGFSDAAVMAGAQVDELLAYADRWDEDAAQAHADAMWAAGLVDDELDAEAA